MTEAPAGGSEHPTRGMRASHALRVALLRADGEMVTVGEIVDGLQDRAFGFVLLLFALLNTVPLPPGVSSLMGIPVLLVGVQMLVARPKPWLPQSVRRRAFRRTSLVAALRRIEGALLPLERVSRPRWPGAVTVMVPRVVGAVVILLSLYIITPLMFTNIPPAMATVFLAIALIEEDGLMLMLGPLVALVALAISTVLAAGMIAAVLLTGSRFLGF